MWTNQLWNSHRPNEIKSRSVCKGDKPNENMVLSGIFYTQREPTRTLEHGKKYTGTSPNAEGLRPPTNCGEQTLLSR